jgi:ACS family tartrate transporter-like MFS transporter
MNTTEPHPRGGRGERLLRRFWPRPADSLAERTRRRVTLHLIPYLFFLYILAYLDRVNVSVAQFGMEQLPADGGVGFDRAIFGFGAGLFFWGYWFLEIPSTVSIVRWGARWVFVRILILWGICAALVGAIGTPFAATLFSWLPHISEHTAMLQGFDRGLNLLVGWLFALCGHGPLQVGSGLARFVNGLHDSAAYQFYFFRFMLGFFEGGFFPSVIFYLSYWFRYRDRAKAIAGFMAAIPLSSMLGVPVSGLILGVDWFGISGWRWILILEGIAPFLAGFATIFFLPDRPQQAKWLPAEERDWLLTELDREHKAKQTHGHGVWLNHFGMVLMLTCVYFGLNFSSYGLSMFMPEIIKTQAGSISSRTASLLASLPYAMGFLGMVINGRHSDRTGERIWHVAVPLFLLSFSIWLAAALDGVGTLPVYVMIFLVGICLYAHLPAFWPIPTLYLGSTAAASAIGFINMIGNLGGYFGPKVVGDKAVGQTSFASALRIIAIGPLLSAVIILILGYTRRRASGVASAPRVSAR